MTTNPLPATAARRALKETDPEKYAARNEKAAAYAKARRHRLKANDPEKYEDYLKQCRDKQAQLNAGPRKEGRRLLSQAMVDTASNDYQHYSRLAWRKIIDGMKIRALKKGVPFDVTITPEYLISICPTHCPVLGFELKRQSRQDGFARRFSPSVDRLDSQRGYVRGNIIIVSYLANTIRTNATSDQIIAVGTFYKRFLAEQGIVE